MTWTLRKNCCDSPCPSDVQPCDECETTTGCPRPYETDIELPEDETPEVVYLSWPQFDRFNWDTMAWEEQPDEELALYKIPDVNNYITGKSPGWTVGEHGYNDDGDPLNEWGTPWLTYKEMGFQCGPVWQGILIPWWAESEDDHEAVRLGHYVQNLWGADEVTTNLTFEYYTLDCITPGDYGSWSPSSNTTGGELYDGTSIPTGPYEWGGAMGDASSGYNCFITVTT